MSHLHDHQCEASFRDYFTGQILSMFVAGAFGLVGILMYRNDQLGYILALPFHRPVLFGGITVLVLVAFRAISVWREAGQVRDRECAVHDSALGSACDPHYHHYQQQHHEQDSEEDDHGHDTDLAWDFSRLLVLCFPVGLFLIGVPNSGFSQERIKLLLGGDEALTGTMAAVAYRNGTVATFQHLTDAAKDEAKREAMRGQTAMLEGRIRWINAREFTLFRLRMTCCAADVVPLKVRIVLKNGTLDGFNDFDWVQMKGQIQFVQPPNSEQFIPVIVVEDSRDICRAKPRNEYE